MFKLFIYDKDYNYIDYNVISNLEDTLIIVRYMLKAGLNIDIKTAD